MVAKKNEEMNRLMIEAGKNLIKNSDDDIVISGIAGNFPDADGMEELAYSLYNKIEMISDDDRRWKLDHPEIPQRTGKLKEVNKFDAAAFGVHFNQAESMDPMNRILLEKSYEAIIDSGNNPFTLKGSRTGVFIGVCFSESEKTWFYEKLQVDGFGVTGCVRSMLANRVSYAFGFDGPSYVVDTACSSSMYAVEQAYNAIREGYCDSAIVGGCSLCLHPYVSLQFARLGVLSSDGKCKVFDEHANGYCRSEAIGCIFLQKKTKARRMYATMIHVKTNCDGYKEQGITYPSGETQQKLLQEFYEECMIDPSTIAWVEAHGTGTKVGDPEEVTALYNVFCKNRKSPLKIGSVKSNLGHTEPSSGICSIAKVVLAMERSLIPPNIHLNTPRADIEYFHTGEIQVVTDPTPWEGGQVGINSFGFGGANCHALLEWNPKSKKNGGLPEDDIPRLVNISGRTFEAVEHILKFLDENNMDTELIKLFHDIHKDEITSHLYRGFTILTKDKSFSRKSVEYCGMKKELYVQFSALCTNWKPFDKSIFQFPVLHQSLLKMSQAISIDIPYLITDSSNSMTNPVDYFVAVVATQIALYDLLASIDISVDGYFGISLGNLVCAYVDGCCTAEEAIQATYHIAVSVGQSAGKGHQNAITSNLSLLSKCLVSSKSKIMDSLKKIIPSGKPRSEKWLSSCGQSRCDADFIFKNLISNTDIDFGDASISPDDILILNMGPKGMYENLEHASLDIVDNSGVDSCTSLLISIGRLFINGTESDVSKLYPEVTYPVSRSTPMIAPLVRWNHDNDWYVTSYQLQKKIGSGERTVSVSLAEDESEYISGHVIDGRNLFPATGYLTLVWETMGLMKGEHYTEVPVVFENIRFHRATNMSKDGTVDFTVIIQRASGNFEIWEGGAAIVSGRVYVCEDISNYMVPLDVPITSDKEMVLSSKDIYKELRLRGYNYSGLFRSITGLSLKDKIAKVRWHKNWVAFMDNMLQIQMMFKDTRGLFVPTSIDRVVLDGKKHVQSTFSLSEEQDQDLAVYYFEEAELLKCGGIEIMGLRADAIPRRKNLAEAVLEKYEFVPNVTDTEVYSAEQIARIFMQIILENELTINVKAVEISSKSHEILAPTVAQVLSDLPLIQTDITVLGNPNNYEEAPPPGVTIEDKKLSGDQSSLVLLGNNLFGEAQEISLDDCLNALKPEGYIVTTEDINTNIESDKVVVLCSHVVGSEKMLLMKKAKKIESGTCVFTVSDTDYSWIVPAQNAMKSKECTKVIFLGPYEEQNGVLGFVNCIRKEAEGQKAKCVLLMDNAVPDFQLENPFYKEQLAKDLAINIIKNGKWGTYRHIKIEEVKKVPNLHVYTNVLTRGDLSSLNWIQGPIPDMNSNDVLVVHYAAINFRDVMLATGKLAAEVVAKDRREQSCVIGFEFCGVDKKGNRIIGMSNTGALTSLVLFDDIIYWKIPDSWTMEEAVTVPVVYATVLYALIERGKLRKGNSVLIHSGTGGVGQAAINIALFKGCTVFTTVGTQEKRDFIRKHFPQIKDKHIGNSRDTSFEQMIMRETNGRGVDMVLNSLAEEKLLASVRCLAKGGQFLEIGKFDLSRNNPLGLEIFARGCSFQGILLDSILSNQNSKDRQVIQDLLDEHMANGSVKPIISTIFKHEQIETAFRYMTTGKHMGKVIIDMRGESRGSLPENVPMMIEALPRFYCQKNKTYIIIGGLGGFGLELADWLVLREGTKLVLTSRKGITNGYQHYRINIWKSYGVDVQVFTDDVTTEEGVTALLEKASKMGPVGAIFNLAVVLKDSAFENQTEEDFKCSLSPKARATKYLDQISRQLCPELEKFVVFSSVSCGRGNGGQTNYGMANSIMERICEKRVSQGLPGLAIQWGAVGDVGLVAEMMDDHNVEVVIGGTLQQRITSCIEVMDEFLMNQTGIVASMVVAEKKSRSSSSDNIVDTVVNILGIRDLKTVSFHSNLAELGMDSMMAVEIKQTLEREFEVFLTPQDIRGLTIAKLQEIATAKASEDGNACDDKKVDIPIEQLEKYLTQMVPEPEFYEPIIKFNSLPNDENKTRKKLFMIPGIEGFPIVFESLASQMDFEVFCIQLDYTTYHETIDDMATALIEPLLTHLNEKTFNIIGYSFGGLVSMELVRKLENLGYQGNLILIDSAPKLMKYFSKAEFSDSLDNTAQINLILRLLDYIGAGRLKAEVTDNLKNIPDWDSKLDHMQQTYKAELPLSETFRKQIFHACYCRLLSVYEFNDFPEKFLSAKVSLIRPTDKLFATTTEDYGLSKYFQSLISVYYVEGNHATVLHNTKTAEVITEIINHEEPSPEKMSLLHPPVDINIVRENIKQI
ncbi:fatty acid synthase [Halyomorpha halys]|uniref:fatty acid synthase n=1 Tax=Halyomorpha halys TaxID=286706 RepID=UPI0006D4EC74|nr:fatty acid synthase-like isoform X1 [Halyomorpha halys]XP_024217508.1 fatty acid synthase-like isoform X2 [Halyomorpha halys]